MIMLCQGNGQGDFVEIMVGLANKGEEESTPWLRFSPLGGSTRHFCALDRAANSKPELQGQAFFSFARAFNPRKAELFYGGSSNERLKKPVVGGER